MPSDKDAVKQFSARNLLIDSHHITGDSHNITNDSHNTTATSLTIRTSDCLHLIACKCHYV